MSDTNEKHSIPTLYRHPPCMDYPNCYKVNLDPPLYIFQPFGIQIEIQSWIFCLHLMQLLFERCIIESVLHSFRLCLSLHLVHHFV